MSRASELQIAGEAPQKTTERVDDSGSEILDDNGRPYIGPFVQAILDDAIRFLNETEFKACSEKSSTPAKAKVQLLKRSISAQELSKMDWIGSKIPRYPPGSFEGEEWFVRRSFHANRQEKGTAKFTEFDYGLRVDHCAHEGEYTPAIFDTYKVLDWTNSGTSTEEESNYGGYKHITMSGTYDDRLPIP